jgi:excisionase family DNA binding protein
MNQPLCVTLRQASEMTGLGKTTFYELFKEKKLSRRKVGRRTVILMTELSQFIDTLPAAEV